MTSHPLRSPLILGGIAAFFSLAVTLFLVAATPPGMRWLGSNIQSSADTAVYLSYLQQQADGHFLVRNLYAIEPTLPRFYVIWFVLGLPTKVGIHPLIVYELARPIGALFLIFAIWLVARSMMTRNADVKLATILAALGISTGWLNSIIGNTGELVPDLVTEFAVMPVLLSAAHIAVSTGLLLIGLRYFWLACEKRDDSSLIRSAAAFGILLLFHPYFAFVVGPYVLITFFATRLYAQRTFSLKLIGLGILSGIPTLLTYLPLLGDQAFVAHHSRINILALSSWPTWGLTLLPGLVALGWRAWKRIPIRPEERWICAWIIAAIIAICLPLPFKRKFLEGLNIGIVFLTMPAWVAIRDVVARSTSHWQRMSWSIVLLFAAGLSAFHLTITQISMAATDTGLFYEAVDVFDAWTWLKAHGASSTIITDTVRANLWTPAYTGQVAWLGHPYETPDYFSKQTAWKELNATNDPVVARSILETYGTTHILTTSHASRERFQALLGPEWTTVFAQGDVSILAR